MGIQYGWYIPDRVIYINFYNRVTVDEFNEMNEAIEYEINHSRSDMIHIIQDESNIKAVPAEFSRLVKESVVSQGKISGWVITIGKDSGHPLMKFISTISTKMSNTRYKRFQYREEAEAYLEAVDPSIDLYEAESHFLEITVVPGLR